MPDSGGTIGTPTTPSGVANALGVGSLSLDRWREILGYHPWHFWQMATNSIQGLEVTSACNSLVFEHSWQNDDSAGRDRIRDAITVAEQRLFEYLNFRVNPQYVEKTFQYPRPYDRRMQYSYAADGSGRYLAINVKEGYIQAVGTSALEDLGDQGVTYSSLYGGGLDDTFTVSSPVEAGTDPAEIAVYFISSDRFGEPIGARWQVKPINVSVDGTLATITGRRWLLVRPVLYEGWASPQIDPTDTSNFVTELSVQRVYTDPNGTTPQTAQAMLIWETDPPYNCCPCINCSTSPDFDPHSNDPAAEAYAIGRVVIRDGRLGELAVGEAVWDATNSRYQAVNWSTCRQPDRVQIRYLAGADLNEVSSPVPQGGSWETVVARLAMAELAPYRICACDNANQQLWRWQFDRSRAAGANDEQYRISEADLGNPFGTREGHIYAWHQVKNLMMVRGRAV